MKLILCLEDAYQDWMTTLGEELGVMLFVAFKRRISLMVDVVGLQRVPGYYLHRRFELTLYTSRLLAQSVGAVERGTERPDPEGIMIKARVTNNSVRDMTDR